MTKLDIRDAARKGAQRAVRDHGAGAAWVTLHWDALELACDDLDVSRTDDRTIGDDDFLALQEAVDDALRECGAKYSTDSML